MKESGQPPQKSNHRKGAAAGKKPGAGKKPKVRKAPGFKHGASPGKEPSVLKGAAAGRRRSLSQRNIAFRHEGEQGELLAEALRLPEESGYQMTHRFHPYPGRFHPHLPRTILRSVAAGSRLCDPFMGGGTALVEALLQGLPAIGSDLNPIAAIVARERTRPRTPEQVRRVCGEAERVAARVEALRREKKPPRAKLSHPERLVPFYQRHLLAELMQWHRLINEIPPGPVMETLLALFSSGVVKFSNRPSDSKAGSEPPSYPKGAVGRFLLSKCTELTSAQLTLHRRLKGSPALQLLTEDARLLPSLGWDCCDIIISSPPYPGTYDYLDQHSLRLDWLELEKGPFSHGEIGPRREGAGDPWRKDMEQVLATMARILAPGGSLYLVLADWVEGSHAIDAAKVLRRIAEGKGWRAGSWASARRDVFSRVEKKAFAKNGKWEHLLMYKRGTTDQGRE